MEKITEKILNFRKINELKLIYRFNSCGDRKESSAEHSWSAEMLARYIFLITKIDNINKEKVYELLCFHDLVEIQSGDFPINPNKPILNKKEIELEAANILKTKFHKDFAEKFYDLFTEFEEQKTKESRLAKAIDKLDAFIHELDYPQDWKDWSRSFIIKDQERYFIEFPILLNIFHDLIDYLEENKII